MTSGRGDLILTTFVASCLSKPGEASKLVESMAVAVSEWQHNKDCLEREALKAIKGSYEDTRKERELTVQEVMGE